MGEIKNGPWQIQKIGQLNLKPSLIVRQRWVSWIYDYLFVVTAAVNAAVSVRVV